MVSRRIAWANWGVLALLLRIALSGCPVMAQYGIVLSGVGPINRSMAGAAVAAPIDASGAIHWNPASISGLPQSEMEFGLETIWPQTALSSSIAASAFGPGFPPLTLSGSTNSGAGVFPLPTFGLVCRPECSPLTYGVGVFEIGGLAVNYPGSSSNPILTPQPPRGFGLGPVFANLQVFQIAPTLAYQLSERLSLGFAPTVTFATLTADPALFASPDDANGDGFATYPAGTHSRFHWGGGFQVGLYYTLDGGWSFGASFKSPQWLETFHYNSADELGRPRTLTFDVDYPLIVSLGAAYSGFERWLLAADVRYIDYRHTDGFRSARFDSTGAVTGLGWESIVAVAVGAQYQLNEAAALRMGYSFNENPIADAVTSFNVFSPTIIEHTIYVGASYRVTSALLLSLAYAHAFENSISGPIVTAAGALSGTSVKSEAHADSLMAGASVRF